MELKSKLTVFFDAPFWVGIFERSYGGYYEVCKVTFGAEPKDFEVYNFILKNLSKLPFSESTDDHPETAKKINPKRFRREIYREVENSGPGTKAQNALKLERESKKLEKNKALKLRNDQEKDEKFQLRQQKKKEKHKGH